MFTRSTIDLTRAGGAGSLVADYLAEKPGLREFYEQPPSIDGFRAFIEKKPYENFERGTLVTSLKKQAERAGNTSPETLKNILLLGEKNSYAITTGHQLCLFTGPLYFIYKIATAVRLAEKLAAEFPGLRFVPVFWMASEDHDFAEINHFNTYEHRISWNSRQGGAVGRFQTKELRQQLGAVEELFGTSENGSALIALFRQSYLEHNNLADATRFLVNALFGPSGIVVVDGDDKALKELFREEMTRDLFENFAEKTVNGTVARLTKLRYPVQVHPRKVNLFLLKNGERARIDADGKGGFKAGDENITADEMRQIIASEPEKLSPNVTLRGLYQQKILPNIAYVGGPGELSYWLEYRDLFEASAVTFPVLVPRNSFTIIDEQAGAKLARFGIEPADLYQREDEMIRNFQQRNGNVADLATEKDSIAHIYEQLKKKSVSIDPSLEKHLDAIKALSLKRIDGLTQKLDRALRKRSETELNRLRAARDLVFPGSSPQERYLNFSPFFLVWGSAFIGQILSETDPFLQHHVILVKSR